MARGDARIEHLLRRAGFGATEDELNAYSRLGYAGALDRLLNYESVADTVDTHIGEPGYVGITARGQFLPNTVITDARQRWLFRMVHTQRPLQEKMTLFWHNHFATAYSKIAGVYGSATSAARMMAAKRVRGRRARPRAARDVPRQRARELPRHAGGHREGSRDARVARRPPQHAHPAAGELRARADGAVQHRRRLLHGARRVRGGPRVHRLEPAQEHRRRRRREVRLLLRCRPARHRGEDVLVPHLLGRKQDHSRPLRG